MKVYLLVLLFLVINSLKLNTFGANNLIDFTVIEGNLTFSQKKPFIINLKTDNPKSNHYNLDLMLMIDISGSMLGDKIRYIKKSLEKLLSVINKEDRISILLFNHKAKFLYNLDYINDYKIQKIMGQLDDLIVNGGTNIFQAFEKALDVFINESKKNTYKSKRIPSIILISDGEDFPKNDINLIDEIKKSIKHSDLYLTIHTIGYGLGHNPYLLKNIAQLFDGNYYYVNEYEKLATYLLDIYSIEQSVLIQKADIIISLKSNNIKFNIIYGFNEYNDLSMSEDYKNVKLSLLHLQKDKTYTIVFDTTMDDDIYSGEEIIEVYLNYRIDSISKEKTIKHYYNLTEDDIKEYNIKVKEANDEYIRSVLFEFMKLADSEMKNGRKYDALQKIAEMRNWLVLRYSFKDKWFKEVLETCRKYMYNDKLFKENGKFYFTSLIREGSMKKSGTNLHYTNEFEKKMNALFNNTIEDSE